MLTGLNVTYSLIPYAKPSAISLPVVLITPAHLTAMHALSKHIPKPRSMGPRVKKLFLGHLSPTLILNCGLISALHKRPFAELLLKPLYKYLTHPISSIRQLNSAITHSGAHLMLASLFIHKPKLN